ncbi:MAG: tetratricopeptide repeat protein [Pedobacter sp.]|nr:MAG: tetratricopeptide repeat protein [Pedobacter sp.]
MKKILLSMLFAGTALLANAQKAEVANAKKKWADYAASKNSASIDQSLSKFNISADKIKKDAGATNAKAGTLAGDLEILNAGLAHTDLATTNEKSKDMVEGWSYRALFASRIALIDSLDLQNSIAKQKIAEEAIEKAKALDTKKAEAKNIEDATLNVDQAMMNRGIFAFNKKDYEGAMNAFIEVTKKNPKDTGMYVNAGSAAYQAKKYPQAAENFKKAIDVGYKDAYPLYRSIISITGEELKDSASYISLLNEASAKYPDSSVFTTLTTDYYMKKGDVAKSQEMLSKLISKEPSNGKYHYLLGDTYFKQALLLQDKRQGIDPKKKKEYDDMTTKMMGLIDQSLPHYQKALQLDAKDANAVDKLKSIYGFKNDTPNYEKMAKLLKELEPGK